MLVSQMMVDVGAGSDRSMRRRHVVEEFCRAQMSGSPACASTWRSIDGSCVLWSVHAALWARALATGLLTPAIQ